MFLCTAGHAPTMETLPVSCRVCVTPAVSGCLFCEWLASSRDTESKKHSDKAGDQGFLPH